MVSAYRQALRQNVVQMSTWNPQHGNDDKNGASIMMLCHTLQHPKAKVVIFRFCLVSTSAESILTCQKSTAVHCRCPKLRHLIWHAMPYRMSQRACVIEHYPGGGLDGVLADDLKSWCPPAGLTLSAFLAIPACREGVMTADPVSFFGLPHQHLSPAAASAAD